MWSQKTTWLCVIGTFAGWAAVGTFVMLILHSGYGGSFLGIWTPPNTDAFRRVIGIGALFALLASTALAVVVAWRGSGAGRWFGVVQAGLGALAFAFLVF